MAYLFFSKKYRSLLSTVSAVVLVAGSLAFYNNFPGLAKADDITPPTVDSLTASVTGDTVTVNYTVSDDVSLDHVVLSKSTAAVDCTTTVFDGCSFSYITGSNASFSLITYSGQLTDTGVASGSYVYVLQATDEAINNSLNTTLLVSVGASGGADATPTPSDTPTPTPSDTPTPTPTPSDTPTPTPSDTPTPTPSDTPTPTPTPSSTPIVTPSPTSTPDNSGGGATDGGGGRCECNSETPLPSMTPTPSQTPSPTPQPPIELPTFLPFVTQTNPVPANHKITASARLNRSRGLKIAKTRSPIIASNILPPGLPLPIPPSPSPVFTPNPTANPLTANVSVNVQGQSNVFVKLFGWLIHHH